MRGLEDAFVKDLIEGKGNLDKLLGYIHNDDSLSLEIRDNTVDIYYRGRVLYTIGSKNGKYIFKKPAKNYYKGKPYEAILKECWNQNEYVEAIKYIKASIDGHGSINAERECQQQIIRENNRLVSNKSGKIANDTDYYIADFEYKMTDINNGEIDLVAVKLPAIANIRQGFTTGKIAFIELKYGDGAIETVLETKDKNGKVKKGNPGLGKHLKDVVEFYNHISSSGKKEEFFKEILMLVNQKLDLGVISPIGGKKEKRINRISDDVEFIFILANHKPTNNDKLINELAECEKVSIPKEMNVKFAYSSCMGYGLYGASMVGIGEFQKSLL